MASRFLFFRSQRASLLRWSLLCTALLDELLIGFSVVGLPLLRDHFRLSYEQAGLIFSVGALSAMMLEPIINLLSDRGSKRFWILGGLFTMAAAFVLAGNTSNFIVLLLAFALLYPATGAGVSLSQAALIDADPQNGTQTMTQWTLMSSIGDLLSPIVVAAIVALSVSGSAWSTLCWIAASLWLGIALFIWPQRFPQSTNEISDIGGTDSTPASSILASLCEALRNPHLLRWAILSIIPTMMDEIFLGFVALYLHDALHVNEAMVSFVIAIHMIGDLLGLLALGPLAKRMAPQQLLLWLALLTLIGVIGFLITNSIWLATFALFIIGLGVAGWYPIAQAEAYAQLPGRSGTVLAIIGLGTPFEIALPGIVGFIAGRFGLLAGLGFLGLAPIFMLLLIPRHKKG